MIPSVVTNTRIRVATRLAGLEGKVRYLTPMLQGKVPDPESFIKSLLPLDPTGLKGDFLPVLVSFVLQHGQESLPEGLKESLAWYSKYKKFLPVQLRDSSKLNLAILPTLVQIWARDYQTPDQVPQGAKEVYREGPYRVMEVQSYAAMCHYSEGLGWCVKDKPFFDQYTEYQTPLYVILKNDKHYALVSLQKDELKDIHNLRFDTKQEIMLWSLLQKAFPNARGIESRIAYLERLVEQYRDPKNQKWIQSVPSLALEYSLNYLGRKPFPAGEAAIASDPSTAILYARDVLKDPEPNTWGKRYLAQSKS